MNKICKNCKSAYFLLTTENTQVGIIYLCKSLKRKRALVAAAVAKGIPAPSPSHMKLSFSTDTIANECDYFKSAKNE